MADNLTDVVAVLGPEFSAAMLRASNLVSSAAAERGLVVSLSDVLSIDSVKLATLADREIDIETAIQELSAIPAVQESIKIKLQTAEGKKAMEAKLAGMTATQRMTFARANGLTGGTRTPGDNGDTFDQRALDVLKGAAKISYARKYGLENG